MRKISSIKTSKVLVLLLLMSAMFVGCGGSDDDDDDDELGNWFEQSSFDGSKRSDAVTFTIGDKGYLFGGFDGDDRLNDLWVYNTGEDNNDVDFWTEVVIDEAATRPSARNGAVGFSIGDKGYIGTGYDGDDELNDFWEFDPETNTWTQLANFPGSARFGAIGFSLEVSGVEYGYIGTGEDSEGEQKTFYRYNAADDSWEQVVGFGGDKRSEASVFVINNVAYIAGGSDNGAVQTDFYSFDGTTWSELTDLDDDDEDNEVNVTSGVAFSIGGKGYLGVGLTGSVSQSVWEYTPEDDSWDEVPDFEGLGRQGASAFTFEGLDRGYVLLGTVSNALYFDDVWEFQPDVLENEDD